MISAQRDRLKRAADEAVTAYEELLTARVNEVDMAIVSELQSVFNSRQHRFHFLLVMQGYIVGDLVRVIDGPYLDQEGVVEELDRRMTAMKVRWPDGSPCVGVLNIVPLSMVMLAKASDE